MSLRINEVKTREEMKTFLSIADFIYKDDSEYVKHLDSDIIDIFDKKRNPLYQFGDAKLWIAFKEDKPIGRIAAFYHHEKKDEPFSGIGFFECVQDAEIAKALFDTSVNWLKTEGMNYVDAPVNFGQRDSFWGLMVSGYKNPSYRENYNKPYYKAFFENYGFEKLIEQTTCEITKNDFNYERFSKLASRVFKNERYVFKPIEKSRINEFCHDFISIYNQAWAHHEDFRPLDVENLIPQIKQMFPILPEKLNWFVYADGEPAGIFINVLDVNQVFKKVNGKLDWIGKLKFLYYKRKINRIRGIVFGVIPKYHNLGLEVGMIMKFYEEIYKPEYSHIQASELAWVGDFNPKMLSMFDSMGAKKSKIHFTYRKKL